MWPAAIANRCKCLFSKHSDAVANSVKAGISFAIPRSNPVPKDRFDAVTNADVASGREPEGCLSFSADESALVTMAAPPPWLEELANAAAARLSPVDLLAPLGCHYCFVDDQWEVTLFAANTEILGGRKDGALCSSKFSLNVFELFDLFEEVRGCQWQSLPLGSYDELGAHISLEGTYAGQGVWLRILASAPRRFRSGRLAHVHDHIWEEVW